MLSLLCHTPEAKKNETNLGAGLFLLSINQRAIFHLHGLLKQKNQALADAYMQKGAPAIRKTMQTAKKRDSDLANRAMNQAKIGGGFSTGASGLLKPSQPQNKEDEWSPDKELSSGNY